MKQNISKLLSPFPYEEVDAKIQVVSNDKTKGMAVFYLDSRAIQKRLDEAIGPLNWSNHYSSWQDKAQICGISIFNEERGEWVTKHDGAENSDIEAIKGGLTDAFKRAAVLWGIGRYLYQIDGCWVEIEQRGKGSYIKDNQQNRLKAVYEAAVKKIFAAAANSFGASGEGKVSAAERNPAQPQGAVLAERSTPVQGKPRTANSQAAPPASASAPITTPESNNNEQKPTSISQAPVREVKSASAAPSAFEFKVHSVKPSGKSSQLLELCDGDGEITSAYVKSGEQGIAVGAYLRNVRIEEKTGAYGKYSLIAGYELAAA